MNSIDEMMIRFFGRSVNTFRIRGKPISSGYKMMALCCSITGFFCYAMTPHTVTGISEVNAGDQVVARLVEYLANQLPRDETPYCLVMDNYFTTPSAMKTLREMKIGAMGTARHRRGWPPKKIADKTLTKDFNAVHYLNDDVGSRVFRWVDNNVVTFVSTVHDEEAGVKANRKKPRITVTNRHNVNRVWHDQHRVEIEIPQFINDYNFNMNGVDRADQLVAAYAMNHKCRRTWLPLLLYCINIARINSYICHRELGGEQSHLQFTMAFSKAFWDRRMDVLVTRKRAAEALSNEGWSTKPRYPRMRASAWELPKSRLKSPDRHLPVAMGTQRRCFYCRWKAATAKEAGEEPPKVLKTTKQCSLCPDTPLCKACFPLYHSRTQEIHEI